MEIRGREMVRCEEMMEGQWGDVALDTFGRRRRVIAWKRWTHIAIERSA